MPSTKLLTFTGRENIWTPNHTCGGKKDFELLKKKNTCATPGIGTIFEREAVLAKNEEGGREVAKGRGKPPQRTRSTSPKKDKPVPRRGRTDKNTIAKREKWKKKTQKKRANTELHRTAKKGDSGKEKGAIEAASHPPRGAEVRGTANK